MNSPSDLDAPLPTQAVADSKRVFSSSTDENRNPRVNATSTEETGAVGLRPERDIQRHERPVRLAILLVWFVVAAFLASRHVMWRDEVRAYSFATSGDTVIAMLRNLQGEGHPSLWYLMLRGLSALTPDPHVLAVLAFVIGAAASSLFALRAPFRWPIIALVLFGRFALYEYTVMARNYGISMLILFAIAALYRRYRDAGWVVGGLLLLLCNTNVHSAMLAAALLLFWLIDVASETPIGWTRPWKAFLVGALLAAVGAALCALEVYPPINNAFQATMPNGSFLIATFNVGQHFDLLVPHEIHRTLMKVLIPLILVGCLLRAIRSPGALAASIAGIVALLLLFTFVYGGGYRHQALLVPFLLTIAWLEKDGYGGRWPKVMRTSFGEMRLARGIGIGALLALLVFQDAQSAALVSRAVRGMPESRSFDLAQLLRRPALRDAIVIGDPDFMLEPLRYYAPNPTYLLRERRYGRYAIFSKAAYRDISLNDILHTAERLHAQTGRSIVIALGDPLWRSGQPGSRSRNAYGHAVQTPDQLMRFHAATRLLVAFDHVTRGDESYDVYLYDGQRPASARGATAIGQGGSTSRRHGEIE